MQIRINSNPKQTERNFILYVKNGEERGKFTFNQSAYKPEVQGDNGSILIDPMSYDIDAKGGEIETGMAENIDMAPYIYCIYEVGGKEFYSRNNDLPSSFKVEGLITATVIEKINEDNPEFIKIGAKLKLNVEPNTTGKEREIVIDLKNGIYMNGYVIVFQSAN